MLKMRKKNYIQERKSKFYLDNEINSIKTGGIITPIREELWRAKPKYFLAKTQPEENFYIKEVMKKYQTNQDELKGYNYKYVLELSDLLGQRDKNFSKKRLELYNLMGDNDSITKWQQALESAKKDLEYARKEMEKDKKPKEEQDKKVEEEKQPDRTDTERQEDGYSYEEQGRTVKEQQQQILKDYSGQEIGNRTITWNTDLENGTTDIETVGQLENDDGIYSMRETTRGVGNEIQLQRKEMTRDNKQTGQKEQYVYQRDDKGNEMYYRTANGKITYKMTKNERGITIDTYDNGQLTGSYEYDKDGKAIDGLPRNR